MCSSGSQRVKCLTRPSAATAPVTSLVTTRKRSSLWWRPTTISFAENPRPPINQETSHSSTSIRKVGSAVTQRATACSKRRTVAESRLRSYFLPVVPARQTDQQLQRACDCLLCRPWLEIATSNTNERRTLVNKPHKHQKPSLWYVFEV